MAGGHKIRFCGISYAYTSRYFKETLHLHIFRLCSYTAITAQSSMESANVCAGFRIMNEVWSWYELKGETRVPPSPLCNTVEGFH